MLSVCTAIERLLYSTPDCYTQEIRGAADRGPGCNQSGIAFITHPSSFLSLSANKSPMNRKNFLRLSSLGLASLSLKKPAGFLSTQKPIVISTWDTGMGVNAAAWKVLEQGGKALYAVEAGGIFIEDQPSCCVGLGGYPDRDGIVTLDSCIMDE